MGCLVKSSLSALSSVEANVCPSDLTLDQYYQPFNGDFQINFVSALSGIQDFKNLNFSNFYLSNNFLLDNVTSYNDIKIKPDSFFTTFNFSTSGNNYLIFKTPSLSSFKDTNNVINAKFYGTTSVTSVLSNASDFEIKFIDDFTCSVSTIAEGKRYFLVVSDDEENALQQREVLFVAENKLSTTGGYLEYNLVNYG